MPAAVFDFYDMMDKMKIISWNVNGLRAVYKKNFPAWFDQSQADCVCLQEIKASKDQLPPELINPSDYFSFFNSAHKKGYSGVAVYTKKKPQFVKNRLGMERFDSEGRILELHFDDLILINVYLPNGDRSKKNLPYKLEVYQVLLDHLKTLKNKKVVVVGDFNIAHHEIDLARPKEKKNNIMFTPAERAQLDKLEGLGFIDTFRHLQPEGGHYTWWPYFYHARERNLGWRIDYVFASTPLKNRLEKAFILKDVAGSDHCPLGITLDL